MGRPMAEDLLKAGRTLVIHNRSRSVIKSLAQQGAEAAGSPREALQHTEQIREVYFGSNGIVDSITPGQLIIDFATVEPTLSREFDDVIAKKGGRLLDASVSGGPAGAAAATLTAMVGGEAEDFAVAKPILDCVGTNIRYGSDRCRDLNEDLQSNSDRRESRARVRSYGSRHESGH